MTEKKTDTIAVRTGIGTDTQHHAVVPPLYLSTNYRFPALGDVPTYDYARGGNPTRAQLEQALTDLEGGAGAVVTNCGMSAINLVLSLLEAGDHIVAPHDCYGGTYRLLESRAKQGIWQVSFVDQSDHEALAQALAKQPKLVLVETPSNPLLRVVDIAEISQKAHQVGARVVVDNTFLSPALQKPFALGADMVVHSTTKFINGHSDIVGGVVVARTDELADTLAWWGNCLGATGNAFDSYMTLRGLRTLGARVKQHQHNTEAVLSYLQTVPAVRKIYYPGLASHPGHQIAARQQAGFGSMLSLELETDQAGVARFIDGLSLFALAESLGGVESLITHPGSMTHRAMSDAAQAEAGISPTLLRLSIGLEDAQDLVADLANAFARLGGNPR
ncbi:MULTISPECIES: cystathionine gamma-synthase [Salinivibrio]|uniref:cystathionine gamma-synthase n=1 Tax=Salinivibrio TaxID=51366 RepID=UPI00084816EC|nr:MULTISPECIES: cystathionine gamma-synthase [Salinivibrio]ODP97935.1 O-succinylhomoserine (thiol)-lyase [Salinivibrio sp. BNH]OOE49290.1 O-succinylhomoserine (thiol)-lyase [Salinivibrio kushneri]OOE52881.1 O-succinylhomoserine (thiol)-lyase [Salinivibrio kushneri]